MGEVLAVAPLLSGQRPSASTENAAAHVRLLLPEPDLPRLRTGQDVRLFLTAYPHQRHGTLRTQLTWISPTPQATAGTAQFFALAAVPAFNAQMPVRIGMTGEARVLTGRRTVLELAMEPLRALRERQFR